MHTLLLCLDCFSSADQRFCIYIRCSVHMVPTASAHGQTHLSEDLGRTGTELVWYLWFAARGADSEVPSVRCIRVHCKPSLPSEAQLHTLLCTDPRGVVVCLWDKGHVCVFSQLEQEHWAGLQRGSLPRQASSRHDVCYVRCAYGQSNALHFSLGGLILSFVCYYYVIPR